MNRHQIIDHKTYERAATFQAFIQHDMPVYSVTCNVDITRLIRFCKENEIKFFPALSYFTSATVNGIAQLRQRVIDNTLYEFETVDPGYTVLLENNTFTFCDSRHSDDFHEFVATAERDMKRVKTRPDMEMRDKDDMFFISNNPWFSFTSFTHPYLKKYASIPIVTFGKYFNAASDVMIPVAIQAHHALVDGFHIGQFYERLSAHLAEVNIQPDK